MKLFAVYLGGEILGSHIEMHDIRFVVGNSIEETYPQLRKEWIGGEKFHIDAFMELRIFDGYEIILTKEKPHSDKKLFFVYMGAYEAHTFGELHEVGFFVCDNEAEAVKKAMNNLVTGKAIPHKDNLYDVDEVIELSSFGEYYVHLKPTNKENQKVAPDWYGYNTDVRGV